MATSGDKFRTSCVFVAATYAVLGSTPFAHAFGITPTLVVLLTVWIVCTFWTTSAYITHRRPGLWRTFWYVVWLQVSILFCLAFVTHMSMFTSGVDPWLVY